MIPKFFVSAGSTMVLAISIDKDLISTAASALAILVAAIFVGIVNVITARSAAAAAAAKAIAPVALQISELVPVVAKIDAHVNSDKTKDQGTIAAQDMQLSLQREMIDELKKAAALLAQAKATTDMSNAIAQAAVAGATTPAVAPAALAPAPAPASPLAAVTDAAKTIAEAVPQLDSIEQTGEATHGIVQEIEKKP